MKIICTNVNGAIAYNVVQEALNRGHSVIVLNAPNSLPNKPKLEKLNLDISDLNALERIVLDVFPDAILNCSDVPSSDINDDNIDFVKAINVDMPEKLAQLAFHLSSRFIHISSDMIFDGRSSPILYTDIPSPYNLYGHTKLMAEKKVLKAGAKCSVVLRVPQILGKSLEGNSSLNEKFFLEAKSGAKQSFASNDKRMCASAKNIADLVIELCERASVTGIHQFATRHCISQFELAKAICEQFKLDFDKLIEPYELDESLDFTLDCTDLIPKVKARPYDFDEVIEALEVPSSCEDWYYEQTSIKTIKRFKLD